MNDYSFSGKHILVTGASGGLGSAIARRLADMGAHLVVTSRSMGALEDLISMLPENCKAIPITADLSRPGEAERLGKQAVEELGYIDVLFNNAGIGYFALMEEASEERLRHLFELNTFSPLMLIKTLIPEMKKRGKGRIINIVSSAGRVPIPSVGVYGGSKSALAVMTNTMRLELQPSGIDIINIYPGTTATSFEENAIREGERSGLCPAEKCGLPRFEIADQVLKAAQGPSGEAWLEREGKWLSLAAIVFPGYVDRKLSSLRDKVIKSEPIKKRRWRLLQVESTIACNLRCVMCPWREIAKGAENKGFMTQAVWDGIRPYLSEVNTVDFTGGGEPLLQPKLIEWIQDAKSAGCETAILTNGFTLNEKTARELLGAGLDQVCVSMDGATEEVYNEIRVGSDFNKVCDNLSGLARMRTGEVPSLAINFVIMKTNAHQIEDMIRLAEDLGVDRINLKQCDVIRGDQGKGLGLFGDEETKEIRQMEKSVERARKLAKKLKLEIKTFSFTPEELPVCDQDPRDEIFIRHDGAVSPCINLALGGPTTFLGKDVNMPTVHYGRLPEQDLMELWETETCRFYRDRFQKREDAHEKVLMDSLLGASGASRNRALQKAREAMPEAPEGCQVCHYLYDI